MIITVEMLKSKGACSEGLSWFKERYGESCEYNTMQEGAKLLAVFPLSD